MSILRPRPPRSNPARCNPRDSWPAWTASDRWGLGPDPDDTRDHSAPFEPSAADEAERLAILSDDESERDSAPSDSGIAEREREANLAAHFDRWDALSPNELLECRGHHPAMDYDNA